MLVSEYLKPTPTIDCDHPAVIEYAQSSTNDSISPRDRAVRLFYAVRDGIRYDAYSGRLTVEGLQASNTLKLGYGFCIPKAILLTACCRAVGLPAKVGFADVRNHLATERMLQYTKKGIFLWHGYTSICIDGKWIKATPAFDIGLCQRFRIKPLEFDGYTDALFHPYDIDGKLHMEYLRYRGEFADVPLDQIKETYLKEYETMSSISDADFNQEIEQMLSGEN
jgi:transglutaminase-like putative cysteine protease